MAAWNEYPASPWQLTLSIRLGETGQYNKSSLTVDTVEYYANETRGSHKLDFENMGIN